MPCVPAAGLAVPTVLPVVTPRALVLLGPPWEQGRERTIRLVGEGERA